MTFSADQNRVSLRIIDANLNRAREALRVLEDFARLGMDDPHLLDTYGELVALAGRLPEARASLEKCVAKSIDNPRTHAYALFHLGRVYSRQGERVLARDTLLDARKVDREKGVLSAKDRTELDRLLQALSP